MFGLLPDRFFFLVFYSCLVVGLVITAKLFQLGKGKKGIRIKNSLFLISLFYHILNFYIIYDFLTLDSGGHGNPFIPYIIISAALFICFCIAIIDRTYRFLQFKSNLTKSMALILSFIAFALSLYLQLDFVRDTKSQLSEPVREWWMAWKDPRFGGLYFNAFTFVLLISSVVFLGTLGSFAQRGEK